MNTSAVIVEFYLQTSVAGGGTHALMDGEERDFSEEADGKRFENSVSVME
jgi:hypothetical protein